MFGDGAFDDAGTWSHPASPEKRQRAQGNRDLKQRLVEEGKAHAALVFDGDRNHRRQGVSAAALRGALDLIAQAGGGVVEGYPRDTEGKKMPASFLYSGTRSLFEKAGFEFVRSKGQYNCIMRTTVEPA